MAIIIQGFTKCPICNCDLDRPYTATSGCAFPEGHYLFKFCDAPLHYTCVEKWEHRQEFSRGYFDEACLFAQQRPAGLLIKEEEWALICGPAVKGKKPYYVQIRNRDWPITLHYKWEEWNSLLSGGYTAQMEGDAVHAANEVVSILRERFPSQIDLDRFYEQSRA